MELTRRMALTSVLFGGVGTGVGIRSLARFVKPDEEDPDITPEEKRQLVAVAEVIYPSSVTDIESVIERYVGYQPANSIRAMREAISKLDNAAKRRYGAAFARLGTSERETLLRELGVDRTRAEAEGTVSEQIRHLLINNMLFALYTTPSGGRQVGIANPRGYPGGYTYGGNAESEP